LTASNLRSIPVKYQSAYGAYSSIDEGDIPASAWGVGFVDSKFCLAVRCDDPNTHAFWHGLATGCIPVVVSDPFELAAWPSYLDTLGYSVQDVAVQIQERDFADHPTQVLDFLKAIPPKQIQKKLANIAKLIPYLFTTAQDSSVRMGAEVLKESLRLAELPGQQVYGTSMWDPGAAERLE